MLIEADKAKDKTASGIIIVEDWKTLPPSGIVKAVGPEVTTVKAGDHVIFERYGAIKVQEDTDAYTTKDSDLRLCKESHIHAVLVDETA